MDGLGVQVVISTHRSDELRQGSVLSARSGEASSSLWGYLLPEKQCPKASSLSLFKPAVTKH